jgi:uncharacterized damage-inducible protein DinB
MVNPDHIVHPAAGLAPDVGAALWMLDDTRARTLLAIDGLAEDDVDAIPIGGGNTIGALLYHIAAVERSWLYVDILESTEAMWGDALFPHQVREENGRLTSVRGIPLDEHVTRLAAVRTHFSERLAEFDSEEFHRPRAVDDGGGTPEWILHHLRQHEAEHRGHIQEIRTLLGQGR